MRSDINPQNFLILVVDDIPTNLQIVRGILEPIGYELTFAMNGKQALERVEYIQPDLILLDMMMPDLNGLEVCEILYRNPLHQEIPIIFLTAHHDKAYLIRAFQEGAVDYITKPFQKLELLARIKTHLELKQYRDRLKKQVEQERLMTEITANILSYSDLEEILGYAVKGIRTILGADRVTICQFMEPKQAKIITESVSEQWPSRLGETLSNPAWLKFSNMCTNFANCLQIIEDTEEDNLTVLQAKYFDHWQIRAEVVLPLCYLENLWGLVIVDYCQDSHHWKTEELNLLSQLTRQTAIAIHQSELYQKLSLVNQELKKLANLDGLTQIPNRRQFDLLIDREWQRLRREKLPLSLIFCDVDHFKKYNDFYGHLAGDNCLKQVAQAIASVVKRPADLVARYGGEEFVILLPNTPLEGAIRIAQKVKQAVNRLEILHAQGVEQRITVSMGVSSQIPMIGSVFEELIDKSDKALFQAKDNGRNQFSVL